MRPATALSRDNIKKLDELPLQRWTMAIRQTVYQKFVLQWPLVETIELPKQTRTDQHVEYFVVSSHST